MTHLLNQVDQLPEVPRLVLVLLAHLLDALQLGGVARILLLGQRGLLGRQPGGVLVTDVLPGDGTRGGGEGTWSG